MPDTTSLMGRLKATTQTLHDLAENRELQRRLVKGALAREQYVAYLAQLYLVHRGLEQRIREAGGPAFEAVLRDYHWRDARLRADLEYFGTVPDGTEPSAATRALLQRIDELAEQQPVALLGMLYVMEGSTNGSKFIARALRKAYGLNDGSGVSYLDPHGDLQKERWVAFKQDMDAVDFSPDEQDAIIDAAKAMFCAIIDLSDELLEPVAA